jgi:hypothetical protein
LQPYNITQISRKAQPHHYDDDDDDDDDRISDLNMSGTVDGASGGSAAEVWQLALKSSANESTAPPTKAGLASIVTDETWQRFVPINPDLGRILAALFDGQVATKPQVSAAAAAGGRWQQLGLTVSSLKSWADMYGTAPSAVDRVEMNSLRMFDGGTKALSAVNIFSAKMAHAVAERINANLRNPFFVRAWNDTTWARLDTLKTDDEAIFNELAS